MSRLRAGKCGGAPRAWFVRCRLRSVRRSGSGAFDAFGRAWYGRHHEHMPEIDCDAIIVLVEGEIYDDRGVVPEPEALSAIFMKLVAFTNVHG